MRRIMLVAGFTAILLVVGALLVPEGEIVTLHTVDAEGRDHSTHLWIAEVEGQRYLRAGDRDAGWLARIRATPDARLAHDHSDAGPTEFVRAVIVDEAGVSTALNAAMDEKYGLANVLFDLFVDMGAVVAVRLEARSPDAAAAQPPH